MATTFTVAIPTHDRRELVTLAVQSALAQTRPPVEVLVLADGCTDGTAAALRALGDERVRVLELPKGPGYAYAHRNLALHEARGEVVSWLGDDDLYLRDHLATIGELWDAGGVDLVQACAVLVDEAGALHPMGSDWGVVGYRVEAMWGHNRTPMAAVSHRPGLALAVGGWRGELARRADIDLWRRMLIAGARTRMSATPTILHVRGTWRTQTPAERVAQNRRLAAAVGEAGATARLRSAGVRAAEGERERLERERAELERERAELLEVQRTLLADIDTLGREVERQRALLRAIFEGGWWRLRDRLLRLSRRGA